MSRSGEIGCEILWLEDCASTQDEARRLSRSHGAPSGTVVVARQQRSGRGRRGRTWHSGGELSLPLTVLLRPPFPPERYPLITLALGAGAVLELRGLVAPDIALKWPNDLVTATGRKLGGILTEAVQLGGDDPLVLVGLGLNVLQRREDFPSDLQSMAASLAEIHSGPTLHREEVLDAILAGFDRGYRALVDGDTPAVEASWRKVSADLDQPARIVVGGQTHTGTVAGFEAHRGLLLAQPDGGIVVIPAEQVAGIETPGSLY